MSNGPARLSRRSLLRGAASATVLAALATVPSCTNEPTPAVDAPDGASPLLRLGQEVVAAGKVPTTEPAATGPGAFPDDGSVVAAIEAHGDAVRADFAAGTTVVAAGWLVSATEAATVAAYAGSCPALPC